MLVLTRRVGQSILVGDDIVVTVLDNGRDQVRIGISAPHNVSVHREEVYAEIRLENRAASETAERDREATVVAQVIDRLPTRSG